MEKPEMAKRSLLLAGVLIAAALDVLVYREFHWLQSARAGSPDPSRRIATLERAGRFPGLNDRVSLELGRAHLERGVSRMAPTASRDSDFTAARRFHLRALALNPFSPVSHFHWGQALRYLNALDMPFPERSFEAFRNAAVLSGPDAAIYAETGVTLLSRWPDLSAEERRFTLDIVRSLLSAGREDQEKAILEAWNLSVRDPGVLASILPPDASAFRRAARFLGERTLEREARLTLLSRAEDLDFETARGEASAAESDVRGYRPNAAADRYRNALRLLEGIRFYRNLIDAEGIDPEDYRALLTSVRLGLVKGRIEGVSGIEDVAAELTAYLEIEDRLGAVAELETVLKARGLIDDVPGSRFRDFPRFLFEMELLFKQNRFRDVVRAGKALEGALLVVPEERRGDYARLLELVGDACRLLDDLYESNAYYEKALAALDAGVGVRLKMRSNHERLGNADAMRALDREIRERTTVRIIDSGGCDLAAGEPLARDVVLEGGSHVLRLSFFVNEEAVRPLIAIFFNGRIIAEDFIAGPMLTVTARSKRGLNHLEIVSVNRSVHLREANLLPSSPEGAGDGEES